MGKAGRLACIITPMALTVVSLILLIVVGIGGWNRNDSNLSSLYFFKVSIRTSGRMRKAVLTVATGRYYRLQTQPHILRITEYKHRDGKGDIVTVT